MDANVSLPINFKVILDDNTLHGCDTDLENVTSVDVVTSGGGSVDLSAYSTTAQMNTALALKSNLASPTFTGTVTAPAIDYTKANQATTYEWNTSSQIHTVTSNTSSIQFNVVPKNTQQWRKNIKFKWYSDKLTENSVVHASVIHTEGFFEGVLDAGDNLTVGVPHLLHGLFYDSNGDRFLRFQITTYTQDVDYSSNTQVGMRLNVVLL